MDLFLKIIIVLAAIALFIVTFLINRKIKGPAYTPSEDEICGKCTNTLCKRSKKDLKECEEKSDEE